ncbi:DDE-type integrase/transposase/recombinase [Amycolatopsis bartoniae]|uniref:DDE-type integrase/transposase/recombinase n=1 Tax=Amycolatopsis bartoniae TaxID=941986 RepID=UPI001605E32A
MDDHPRLPHIETLPNEKKETAVAFWQRAPLFFAAHGFTVPRVLTDNGPRSKSRLWRDALAAAAITHKRTRPYRPQTNGKWSGPTEPYSTNGPAPALPVRNRTTRSATAMATRLTSPPRPHRTRRPHPREPRS